MFNEYLTRWALIPDGSPIVTRSSHLLPVRRAGIAAMLKVATELEEQRGASLMAWWDGRGAARVLAQEGNAILLERATGDRSLVGLARDGCDDEASRIICQVVGDLHAPRSKSVPDLIPLDRWFQPLHSAIVNGGIFARCADAARELLASPRDVVVLHGDIHHENILDFGERGWLAIDPKGLLGERGFDYANLFCNPDAETALARCRFGRRVAMVTQAAALERRRLLQWIMAWAGLSALWLLEDGISADFRLEMAEMTSAHLDP